MDDMSGIDLFPSKSNSSCYKNGSLTLLFLPISRQSQNILLSPTHAASISVTADIPSARRPRVSLIGNVTIFKDGHNIPNVDFIRRCYVEKHPDAEWWLPDDKNGAHVVSIPSYLLTIYRLMVFVKAYWARFDPHVSSTVQASSFRQTLIPSVTFETNRAFIL